MWAKPREIARASGLIFYNSLLEVKSEAGQGTGAVRKIITPPLSLLKKFSWSSFVNSAQSLIKGSFIIYVMGGIN